MFRKGVGTCRNMSEHARLSGCQVPTHVTTKLYNIYTYTSIFPAQSTNRVNVNACWQDSLNVEARSRKVKVIPLDVPTRRNVPTVPTGSCRNT